MRYKPDHKGTAQLLVSKDMADMVVNVAEGGMAFAVGISPRETGNYISKFRVVPTTVKVGGQPRVAARIENTASYAAAVEWGPSAHKVLGRTLEELRRRHDPKGR